MAKKFTQLPAVQSLTSADILAVVNGGESKKATVAQVRDFLADGTPSTTLYVDSGGSVNGDGTILAPFASINAALAVAVGGLYVIQVGPGEFDAGAVAEVPSGVAITGTPNTKITATELRLKDNTSINGVELNVPTITANGTSAAGPTTVVQLTNVSTSTPTTITNNGSFTRFITNNGSFTSLTINGGPNNSVTTNNTSVTSSLTVNNVKNFSATASAFLNINLNDTIASLGASQVAGAVTASNGSQFNASSDSYPKQGLTLASGSTQASETPALGDLSGGYPSPVVAKIQGTAVSGTVPTAGQVFAYNSATVQWEPRNPTQAVVLQAVATDGATVVGGVYFPQSVTLTTGSLAYIGGANTNDTVTLKLTPIGGGNPSATWTRVGQLANVALSQASQIAAGWYDLVLAGANSSTTAFARGLYLVS